MEKYIVHIVYETGPWNQKEASNNILGRSKINIGLKLERKEMINRVMINR